MRMCVWGGDWVRETAYCWWWASGWRTGWGGEEGKDYKARKTVGLAFIRIYFFIYWAGLDID